MFSFAHKPRPSAEQPTASKPTSQYPAKTPPLNPSRFVEAGASPYAPGLLSDFARIAITPAPIQHKPAINSLSKGYFASRAQAEAEAERAAAAAPAPAVMWLPRVDAARLDGGVLKPIEAAWGRDLSQVRVHAGPSGAQVAARHDARAIATGFDIYLSAEALAAPDGGRAPLVHELAHVAQQGLAPPMSAAAKLFLPRPLGLHRQGRRHGGHLASTTYPFFSAIRRERNWMLGVPDFDPTPVTVPPDIDWGFIEVLEGNHPEGEVPAPRTSNSGVTIASGYDLGFRDATALRALRDERGPLFSEADIARLTPFLGLHREEAVDALRQYRAAHPLASEQNLITPEQARRLNQLTHRSKGLQVARWYDREALSRFDSIPRAARTVIASVLFQWGVPARANWMWIPAVLQDWRALAAALRAQPQFRGRRTQEAEYLERALGIAPPSVSIPTLPGLGPYSLSF